MVTINVLWLFLTVRWVGLQCVIVVFPDHTHLLFDLALKKVTVNLRSSFKKSVNVTHMPLPGTIMREKVSLKWLRYWYSQNLGWYSNLSIHSHRWGKWEHSGSVVECLTQDKGAAGSSLTGITVLCPWARHIYPSLVLVQPRNTHPNITENCWLVCKESNQTNNQKNRWANQVS